MTDYSWLEPMERHTKEIREETQRIKDETEKMKQETHNLPVPDDAPWLNLSQKEVEELRNKKHELTEYGKQRLRELMNINPTHEEMLDEAARREAENKALAALDELYEKHGDAMLKLAEIEKDNWEQEQREIRVLERYNQFYNTECSGLAHGTPITPEFQQAMALECMLDALRYENLNHEFDVVSTSDINALIEGLYQQGRDYLERVKNNG
jgi:hypothetical protein